ncbi:hypothetical protein BJY01DRAFT_210547 [Aspergillus pseudoustus]|uniref:Uncharacterized protein n=1 Tax=Aspergillus pseudoustus TaxID=1810923 RepID=A0ABR4KBB2_9EURO
MSIRLVLVMSTLLLASLINVIYGGHGYSDGYNGPGQIAAFLHFVRSSICTPCELLCGVSPEAGETFGGCTHQSGICEEHNVNML